VYRFEQDDLESDDVYVLDCYTRIYLWIGKECRPDEKKMVIKNLPVSVKMTSFYTKKERKIPPMLEFYHFIPLNLFA